MDDMLNTMLQGDFSDGSWRDLYDDRANDLIVPEQFETEEEYLDAYELAYAWRDNYDELGPVDPFEYTTEDAYLEALNEYEG